MVAGFLAFIFRVVIPYQAPLGEASPGEVSPGCAVGPSCALGLDLGWFWNWFWGHFQGGHLESILWIAQDALFWDDSWGHMRLRR